MLILDEESGEGLLRQRLRLLGAETISPPLSIWVTCFQGLRLDTVEGQEELAYEITRSSASLVVIDSLVRVHSLEENSASDMKILMGGLARIARQKNCAILLTHHARKLTKFSNEAGQMLRGSNEIKAAADAHLYVKRLGEDRIRIEHEKARYAPTVSPFVVSITGEKDGMLSYVAEEKRQTKLEGANGIIVEILSDSGSAVLKRDLEKACKAEGIGTRTCNEALKRLQNDGVIQGIDRTEHDENNRAKTYRAFTLV